MNKVKIILATAVFALTFSTSQLALANAIVVLKAEQAIFATAKAIALGKNFHLI